MALFALSSVIAFAGNPYNAVARLIFYGLIVVFVGTRLWACYRLTRSSPELMQLVMVTLLLVMAVIGVIEHLTDVIQSENKDFVRLATDTSMYIALALALCLAESALRRSTGEPLATCTTPVETPGEIA
jgi:TctA family transporter